MLVQAFGERHPNRLCHQLGMQLYGPDRHYTALRNLRAVLRGLLDQLPAKDPLA